MLGRSRFGRDMEKRKRLRQCGSASALIASVCLQATAGCRESGRIELPPYESQDSVEASKLRFILKAPAHALSGAPVYLRLNVRNTGNLPASLDVLDPVPVNFQIYNGASEVIWSVIPPGPTLEQGVLIEKPLEPRADRTFEVVWNQTSYDGNRVPSGNYRVYAPIELGGARRGLRVGPVALTIR